MALPAIFCPQCDTLILDAPKCPACQWQRPVLAGEAGEPVWAVALEVKLPRNESHPVARDHLVFFPTDAGQIVAVDAHAPRAESAVRWRYQLDPRYRCHSLALWNDCVLVGSEYTGGFPVPPGELIVLSIQTGEEWRRYPVDGASLSVPAVQGDTAYFTTNVGGLYAVNLKTHQELWRHKIETEPEWSWAPAAPGLTPDGLLIIPGRCNQLFALDSDRKDIAWTFFADNWFPYTPHWLDGTLYVRCWDRHIYALDGTTGRELWRYKAPRDFSSDLWVDDDYVYVGTKDYENGADSGSRAYALHLVDRHTGRRAGRYEVPGHVYARPTAAEGVAFFATDDRSREIDSQGTFYALDTHDPQDLSLLWEPLVIEQRFQSDLLRINDLVVAGTRQGAVYTVRWQIAEIEPEAPYIYLEREAWEDAAIAFALRDNCEKAAEIYAEKLGQPLKAGWLYFHAEQYQQVIELLGQSEVEAEKALAIGAAHSLPDLLERADVLREMGECLVAANAFKEAGDWLGAGDCYREAQAWDEARAAYAQAGAWDKWSELSRELEQWEDLVARHIEIGEYGLAAEIYAEEMGRYLEAADYYDRANMHAEALAAYRRVDPEQITEAVQRRVAELAEEFGEVDVAIETYQELGEVSKAAELAEASDRYQLALDLYRQIGLMPKVAEMMEKLTQYVEAADIFAQAGLWGKAAKNLEQQVDQMLARVGGVRSIRKGNPEIEKWLGRAIAWFEDEHEISESQEDRDFFYRAAQRCRRKLTKLRREPLLKVQLRTDRLVVDESSVVQCEVENVGWGIARNVSMMIESPHAKYPLTSLVLGDLSRDQNATTAFTIVPNIPGAIMLQVSMVGQTRSGEKQEFPLEGGTNIILDPHTPAETMPQPDTELGSLWDESGAGSSEEPDSGVVSQAELRLQQLDSFRKQLAQHYSNLNTLQEDASLYGAGAVPLRLRNQIEAEENVIAELEEKLSQLEE